MGAEEAQIVFDRRASDVTVDGAALDGPIGAASDTEASITLTGLAPDTEHRVEIRLNGATRPLSFRTLKRPPGAVLARVATMNDLHLGLDEFGLVKGMRDRRPGVDLTAKRCARAALDAATRWGADTMVLKGDVVHRSDPEEWSQLDELLADVSVPVHLMMGNHEAASDRHSTSSEAHRRLGNDPEPALRTLDVPGLKVLLADTTTPGTHDGQIQRVGEPLGAALADGRPALVLHHHQLHSWITGNTYPRGVHGPSVRRLLRQIARTNSNVVFASGHTHRHRLRTHHGVVMAELGSTKDYPGTWCGYTVYEGGLVQTVHRVADREALYWTDLTSAAVGGVWGWWSPGRRRDRCFSLSWT